MDHTGTQSPKPQTPEPQSQDPQVPGAMEASQFQPSPPRQPTSPPMACCGELLMRDCICKSPLGRVEVPRVEVSHYDPECVCYSCDWVRGTLQTEIISEIPGQVGRTVVNPTYRGGDITVLENKCVPENQLECVHPVKMDGRWWEWVITPTQQRQLPFLSDHSANYSDAWRVILNSQGNWIGIGGTGDYLPIRYEKHPQRNVLYSDYGYHPARSPVCLLPTQFRVNLFFLFLVFPPLPSPLLFFSPFFPLVANSQIYSIATGTARTANSSSRPTRSTPETTGTRNNSTSLARTRPSRPTRRCSLAASMTTESTDRCSTLFLGHLARSPT